MKHAFNPTILRSYDIRGIFGETLHPEDAFALGVGFAARVKQQNGKRIAIGRDGRTSSPMLSDALKEGLMAGGVDVLDIGLAPTPMLYFADLNENTDGAIQITGSHNPASHNGFKMVRDHRPFFGDEIQHLGKAVQKGVESAKAKGSYRKISIQEEYLKAILERCEIPNFDNKTVIWDCGNGATGPIIEALTDKLPGKHVVLFSEVDGAFPNHHPDPADPETLSHLKQEVLSHQAVCGIAFDGDGDRLGVVDSKGRAIAGDILTAYISRHVLRQHPEAEVIFDIKSSLGALELVRSLGGKASLWKSGHSHMKARLKEVGASVAGEMSGHIFIGKGKGGYYGFDDAIFAALCVMREMGSTGEDIAHFISSLPPSYASQEYRVPCADEKKFAVIEAIIAAAEQEFDKTNITKIDGIRVDNSEGWWLIRASNTAAELVVRAEGHSAEARDMLLESIAKRLTQAGLDWER